MKWCSLRDLVTEIRGSNPRAVTLFLVAVFDRTLLSHMSGTRQLEHAGEECNLSKGKNKVIRVQRIDHTSPTLAPRRDRTLLLPRKVISAYNKVLPA